LPLHVGSSQLTYLPTSEWRQWVIMSIALLAIAFISRLPS